MKNDKKDQNQDQNQNQDAQDKRELVRDVITRSTKAAFENKLALTDVGSCIYAWEGVCPSAGFYRQGGVEIEIFSDPVGDIIGYAV